MSSPMTKEQVEAVRAKFEAWLPSQGWTHTPAQRPSGAYTNGSLQGMWLGYLAAHESLSAGAVGLQLPAEAVVERTFEYSTSTHKYKPVIKILLPAGVDSQGLWEGRDKIARALNACRAAMQQPSVAEGKS